MTEWGADSEYGVLHDVLLGPPDNFRWLPTSAISKATLESGAVFDPAAALAQHDELTAAYEGAGVTVHMLEPDPDLPYQVFARDSSVMTSGGALVTQPAQQWRRGEYAPVIRFYQGAGIPIWEMITAGSLEGGDVTIVEPGCLLIGNGEERTQVQAAEQLAGWMRAEGWEVRIEPIPGQFVHIDVLVSILAPKLAAVCTEAASGGLTAWLRGKGFEILEVSTEDAFRLGVNAIPTCRRSPRAAAALTAWRRPFAASRGSQCRGWMRGVSSPNSASSHAGRATSAARSGCAGPTRGVTPARS
jgi:N-dimethylarginine dimethylaminohydrolase